MLQNFLASLFTAVGNTSASGSSSACIKWFIDEPEMPKSMIEK